jgi:hypothetical protein
MIQLATDPTASRMSYRLARSEDEAKDSGFDTKRGRTGHTWPFLSRYAPQPARQDGQKSTGSGSNS